MVDLPRKTFLRTSLFDAFLAMLRRFFTLSSHCLLWMTALLMLVSAPSVDALDTTAMQEIVVYRSAYCECCQDWESHMAEAGFLVQDHVADDMDSIKQSMGVPEDLASCHTASLDGYVVEGHVPAKSIQRMLAEKPEIHGLAAPGMPMGSPGMEMEGMKADPFSVFAITRSGTMVEFDHYAGD